MGPVASGWRDPAVPSSKDWAVDTTGASGTFTAAFVVHLTAGAPEAGAIQAAKSAAAWTVSYYGIHESMPASN